jgi:HEAT repeat protein
MKINNIEKITAFTNSDELLIRASIEYNAMDIGDVSNSNLIKTEEFILEFTKRVKEKRHKLIFELASLTETQRGAGGKSCRIAGKVLFEKLGFVEGDFKTNKALEKCFAENVYRPFYDSMQSNRIEATRVFILHRSRNGKKVEIIKNLDLRYSLGDIFFNVKGRIYKNSLFWLGNEGKTVIETKRKRTINKKSEEQSWVHKYKIELLKKLNKEDIFKNNKFIEIDIEQKIKDNQQKYQDIKDFITHANSAHSLIILGEVGAGKTTTLKHYLRDCLINLNPDDPNSVIPVFIPLKRYKKYPDITSLVRLAVNEYIYVLPRNKVTFDILSYNFCFIFDGLDEVPYGFRDDAVDDLKSALNQKNKVIISCRLKDYDDNFNNIHNYRLKELTDDQIKKHLKLFFDKDALVIFKQKIKQEQYIHDMAKNPFLLDIMIDIIKSDPDKSLPANKGELIEKYVKIIIKKSKSEKANIPNIEKDTRNVFLGILAFYMTGEGTLTCYSDDRFSIREKWLSIRDQLDSKDKIETILKKAEIERLLKSGGSDGNIEFMNPLIKDYFASYYIKSIYYERNKSIEEKVEELLEFYKWDDVISMLVGIVDDNTSDEIMRLLLDLDKYFAAQCFTMAKKIYYNTEEEVVRSLTNNIENYKQCPDFFNKISALKKVKSDILVNTLITLLEKVSNEWYRGHVLSVLREVRPENAIEPLIEFMKKSENEGVVHRAAYALSSIELCKIESHLIKLLDSKNSEKLLCAVVDELKEKESKNAIAPLIRLTKECNCENILECIEDALVTMKSQIDEETLIKLLDSKEKESVQCIAYRLLGEKKSKGAAPHIIVLLDEIVNNKDKDKKREKEMVVTSMVGALGNIQSNYAIEPLIKLLREVINDNSMGYVVGNIAYALVKINPEKAIEPLIEAIENYEIHEDLYYEIANSYTYKETLEHERIYLEEIKYENPIKLIINELESIKSKKVVRLLIKLLNENHDNFLIINFTIDALGNIGSEIAVPHLIRVMKKYENKSSSVLVSGVDALNKLKTKGAIKYLVNLLGKSNSKFVHRRILDVLGSTELKMVVKDLVKLLKNIKDSKKDEKIIISIVEALGNTESEEPVNLLLELLEQFKGKKNKKDILISIVDALGTIKSKKSIDALRKLSKVFRQDKSKEDIFVSIVYALCELEADNSLELLVELKEREVCEHPDLEPAVFDKLNSEYAIEPLIALMEKNKNWSMNYDIADVLSKIKSEKTVNYLIDAIDRNRERIDVLCCIIDTLGYLGLKSAVPTLISVMKEINDEKVHKYIVSALSRLGAKEVIKPLMNLLMNTKIESLDYFRIRELGCLKSDGAIDFLTRTIKKTDDTEQMYDINRSIIFALGSIASEKSLDSLIELLGTSNNGRVLWNAPGEISEILSSSESINKEEKVQKLREFYNIDRFDDLHVELRREKIYRTIELIKQSTGRRYLKQLKGFP